MCNAAWQQKNNRQADSSMWLWSLTFQFDPTVKEGAGLVNRGIWDVTTTNNTVQVHCPVTLPGTISN